MNGRPVAFILLFLDRSSSLWVVDMWAVLFPPTYPQPLATRTLRNQRDNLKEFTEKNLRYNLAQAAENQPAPQKILQPQIDGTRQSRQRISKALPYVIAFLVIGMPLIFIGIGLVAYLLVSLN